MKAGTGITRPTVSMPRSAMATFLGLGANPSPHISNAPKHLSDRRTLQAWIDADTDAQHTAGALGISRNTIRMHLRAAGSVRPGSSHPPAPESATSSTHATSPPPGTSEHHA
ncbi:helix-turn-helix domain-containing protein [Streptomyces sp. NPDC007164]|uniref:helix-turn-helix domain-containing protein n=1 Tax=Streptomyces sp. NPDC007164 TaxID=3156918 RepID=UPI0034014308